MGSAQYNRWAPNLLVVLGTVGLACARGDPDAASSFGPEPWMLPGDTDPDDHGDDTDNADDADNADNADNADDNDSADDGQSGTEGNNSAGTTTGPPGTDGGTTTGPPPGTEDDGTTTTGMSTFGDGDDGPDKGMQPDDGWWSHCEDMLTCGGDFNCLSINNDGACTQQCNPAGNPGSCGASPGGTNMPVCLTVMSASYCALGCEGGLTCPGGMVCTEGNDDNGAIFICL